MLQSSNFAATSLLDNEGNDKADEGKGLDEGRGKDEAREEGALHLGLTGRGRGVAVRCQADADAGAYDTKTISNNSHDSSFVNRPRSRRRLSTIMHSGMCREMP
jgi:hypothetical protein